MRRGTLVLAIATLSALGLLSAGNALAGGWSVVKLDAVPTDVSEGKTVSIGFTVLQHGVHPLTGQSPFIEAAHASSGEVVKVAASAEGGPGHYVAQVSFPTSGAWTWSINVFEGKHPMPQIDVQAVTAPQVEDAMPPAGIGAPAPAAPDQATQLSVKSGSSQAPAERRLALGLGAGGIAVLAAASVLAFRRSRTAPALARS